MVARVGGTKSFAYRRNDLLVPGKTASWKSRGSRCVHQSLLDPGRASSGIHDTSQLLHVSPPKIYLFGTRRQVSPQQLLQLAPATARSTRGCRSFCTRRARCQTPAGQSRHYSGRNCADGNRYESRYASGHGWEHALQS